MIAEIVEYQPEDIAAPSGIDDAAPWLARAAEWAAARGATDLHFFPGENEAFFWIRIDGTLREIARYAPAIHDRLVARLKVLGRCTDYDGQLVQEGRFTLEAAGEARLSILPTLRGEKAVVRILRGGAAQLRLDQLGFDVDLVSALRASLECPQGLILAIGPSGCGKSTAIHALLRDLHERAAGPLSILTVEDPVEQILPFAAQIGIDATRGLGFAEGLRALLRQDPEVIMIGEIRDADTATTALQAALTGHRLLSSMHTQTPAEALVRLQQMGSPAYVIASALAGVLNVRLVRLQCSGCAGAGCPACMGSGRRGRTGIGEWLVPTHETAAALRDGRAAAGLAPTLKTVAAARGQLDALLAAGRIAAADARALQGLVTLCTEAVET